MWDYPRPPAVEPTTRRVQVSHGGTVLADSTSAVRVLETSQPPAYYLPPEDVRLDLLELAAGTTWCEWKGRATYFDVIAAGQRISSAAWTYRDPTDRFSVLANHVAFYPQLLDACSVDGRLAVPNAGSFYGGWVTPDIVGPFKGEPGTEYW